MKLPTLALAPDDPAYLGRVLSYTTVTGELVAMRYVLILETLAPWKNRFAVGEQVQFEAPSKDFCDRCVKLGQVAVTRPMPERGAIAYYCVESLDDYQPPTEDPMAGLTGKPLTKHVLGALQFAHRVVDHHIKAYYPGDDVVTPGIQLDLEFRLAISLMIAHQQGKYDVPEYEKEKK